MRRWLRVAGWIGCGFSALLLVGTVVLWGRSLGRREWWGHHSFEARPEWAAEDLKGQGIRRWWSAEAIHGRFQLRSGASAPEEKFQLWSGLLREPISAAEAEQDFDFLFQHGERPYAGGTIRAWRIAGVGFSELRIPVDPRIGLPKLEEFTLAIPFWMLTLLFGLWPALVVARRVLRRKRYAPGMCPQCGYDLRATSDPSGPLLARCPECGREVGAAGG